MSFISAGPGDGGDGSVAGLSFDQRRTIRWAIDARARKRLARERAVRRELVELLWIERSVQRRAMENANRIWLDRLPGMFREWQEREAA